MLNSLAMRPLGKTGIEVFPLCLGGNVFGWTADEAASFAVLDAYAEAGGNFIDTADVYMASAAGNAGGESETIIGRWMAARANRDQLVIATKCGAMPGLGGLGAETIRSAAEASLERLGTDRIDLYYAHVDDPSTPQEETLGAFDELVRAGKVRHIGASNYTADRLESALAVSDSAGLARFAALQPKYNLIERDDYEGALMDLVQREGLACVPYFGLARGFLTGKYHPEKPAVSSPRAERAAAHLERVGTRVLDVLEEVAAGHGTSPAAVALAWVGRSADRHRPDRERALDRPARRAPADGRSRARRRRARQPRGRGLLSSSAGLRQRAAGPSRPPVAREGCPRCGRRSRR